MGQPYTDQQIRDRYLADLRRSVDEERAAFRAAWEADGRPFDDRFEGSGFGRCLEACVQSWNLNTLPTCQCVFELPEGAIVGIETLRRFAASEMVWMGPFVTLYDGKLRVEVQMVKFFDPHAPPEPGRVNPAYPAFRRAFEL